MAAVWATFELAMEELHALNKPTTMQDHEDLIRQMNVDQRRVYHHVINRIQDNESPLRLFISGVGGTGKSFVLDAIRSYIINVQEKKTVVLCPTGVAAKHVNGQTIHQCLNLPIQRCGVLPKYEPLPPSARAFYRKQLECVDTFIFDEIGMVSNIIFLWCHLRLCDIFQCSDFFGGKHVIVIGDLLQLPPINAKPSYVNLSDREKSFYAEHYDGTDLWPTFQYEELLINERHSSDSDLAMLCNRFRLGIVTPEDESLLFNRWVQFNTGDEKEKMNLMVEFHFAHKICTTILPTNQLCKMFNDACLSKIEGPLIELQAIDSPRSSEHTFVSAQRQERSIPIKIGSRVLLCKNLDKHHVNGSQGNVTRVRRDALGNILIVFVKFDGESEDFAIHHTHSILTRTAQELVVRSQFPLLTCYAMTVHRTQSLTLKSVMLDLGESVFSVAQAYVAISRVCSIDGLYVMAFRPSCVKVDENCIKEYNRLRSLYKPELSLLPLPYKQSQKASMRKPYSRPVH